MIRSILFDKLYAVYRELADPEDVVEKTLEPLAKAFDGGIIECAHVDEVREHAEHLDNGNVWLIPSTVSFSKEMNQSLLP